MNQDKFPGKILRPASALLAITRRRGNHANAQSAAGVLRDTTARQIVFDMKIGWNLGHTMDASPGETGWGNPVTTQTMIDALKEMGIKTVRIPVSWTWPTIAQALVRGASNADATTNQPPKATPAARP
jgi:endoglucanase